MSRVTSFGDLRGAKPMSRAASFGDLRQSMTLERERERDAAEEGEREAREREIEALRREERGREIEALRVSLSPSLSPCPASLEGDGRGREIVGDGRYAISHGSERGRESVIEWERHRRAELERERERQREAEEALSPDTG
ncbi:hypothetical protein KIPB_014785 [Kipferlia bialata]|uniref:Uncharacterized protein n=1 Tax=Kipferlia bialata TaxID=797122 RepID=A0A9K3D989_9EUKA|nr:hypothetical protein KIPB_014785 [Kipferlia bialata]|eukprot:g14785.t1